MTPQAFSTVIAETRQTSASRWQAWGTTDYAMQSCCGSMTCAPCHESRVSACIDYRGWSPRFCAAYDSLLDRVVHHDLPEHLHVQADAAVTVTTGAHARLTGFGEQAFAERIARRRVELHPNSDCGIRNFLSRTGMDRRISS